MRFTTLGHSGCAVSRLCLGTMTFGAETDEAGSHEQLDVFVEAGGTLVVLMGWDNLSVITETLLREGRAASTPVAVVQWGTEPYQRTVVGDLSNIVPRSRGAGLAPPVVIQAAWIPSSSARCILAWISAMVPPVTAVPTSFSAMCSPC